MAEEIEAKKQGGHEWCGCCSCLAALGVVPALLLSIAFFSLGLIGGQVIDYAGSVISQVGNVARAILNIASPLLGTTVWDAIKMGITSFGNRSSWCGDFAAYVIRQMGYNPPAGYSGVVNWYNKFKAGSEGWRLLGPGEIPQSGDIAMRPGDGPGGFEHIGFVYQVNNDGTFDMLGGNQGGTAGNRQITIGRNRWIANHIFGRLP